MDEARWPVPYWDIDTGMAALLMLLTAVDEGLGGLFFGVPPESHEDVHEAFAIPHDRDIVGVVAIGHPAVLRARLPLPPAPPAAVRGGPRRPLRHAVRARLGTAAGPRPCHPPVRRPAPRRARALAAARRPHACRPAPPVTPLTR